MDTSSSMEFECLLWLFDWVQRWHSSSSIDWKTRKYNVQIIHILSDSRPSARHILPNNIMKESVMKYPERKRIDYGGHKSVGNGINGLRVELCIGKGNLPKKGLGIRKSKRSTNVHLIERSYIFSFYIVAKHGICIAYVNVTYV